MTPARLLTLGMALLALLLLPSCEKEKISEQFLIEVFPEETNAPYHIPVEKALAELESFLIRNPQL